MQKLNADMTKLSDSANFIKSEADKYTQTPYQLLRLYTGDCLLQDRQQSVRP